MEVEKKKLKNFFLTIFFSVKMKHSVENGDISWKKISCYFFKKVKITNKAGDIRGRAENEKKTFFKKSLGPPYNFSFSVLVEDSSKLLLSDMPSNNFSTVLQ